VVFVGPNRGSKRAVLIMPPTGGTNFIDRSYARRLCYAGFEVFILSRWTGDDEKDIHLDLHQKFYSRGVRAIETVLKNIPHQFIGLLGTSVGGLFAAVAASSVDRLDAVFTIVGGAPIPSVVVYSDQEAMVKLKKNRYALYGFKNDEDYLQRLSQEFHLDPFELETKFSGKDLGMVIATQDTIVGSQDQQRLRELWKPRKVIELANGHFWGILNTWLFYSRDVVRFFEESSQTAKSRPQRN